MSYKVSVIIPVYNAADFIVEKTLKSIDNCKSRHISSFSGLFMRTYNTYKNNIRINTNHMKLDE